MKRQFSVVVTTIIISIGAIPTLHANTQERPSSFEKLTNELTMQNRNETHRCLDVIPQDAKTLKHELLVANRQLNDAIEMEQEYLELAIPAQKRSGYLKAAGSALLLYPSLVSASYLTKFGDPLFASLSPVVGEVVGAFTSYFTMMSPIIADIYLATDGTIDAFQEELDLTNDQVDELRDSIATSKSKACSFNEAFTELDHLRDQVIENEMNGTLNAVKDFVMLGTRLKLSTGKLLTIATQKKIIAQIKLTALSKL